MYSGPGAGVLLAAAGSWDSLCAELSTAAQVYGSVLRGLSDLAWRGPTAQAMVAAATPYAVWLHATAEQTQQTAMQARAAAAAFELAHAMTVPPTAVAANRAQLKLLVATNFFGQNTGAIAATEVQYAEYWAQDATAMYGYATSSAAATVQLTPFDSPSQTTNQDGVTAQNLAVAKADATVMSSAAHDDFRRRGGIRGQLKRAGSAGCDQNYRRCDRRHFWYQLVRSPGDRRQQMARRFNQPGGSGLWRRARRAA